MDERDAVAILCATMLFFSLSFIAITVSMAGDDIAKHPKCTFCGMDRLKFAHSRMLVTYDDHKSEGYCSLHCSALMMAYKMGKTPVSKWVGDYRSKQLIPADKAVWVVGGDQRGVMTHKAKWAFADQGDALGFIAKHGGTIGGYETALHTAYGDLYADTKMFWKKRAAKSKHHMGHKHQ